MNETAPSARGVSWRLISAAELALGAFVAIGHNVFRIVPKEAPTWPCSAWCRCGCATARGSARGSNGRRRGGAWFGSRPRPTAYMLSGRNLWVTVLAHGFVDTFGVLALYIGMD